MSHALNAEELKQCWLSTGAGRLTWETLRHTAEAGDSMRGQRSGSRNGWRCSLAGFPGVLPMANASLHAAS